MTLKPLMHLKEKTKVKTRFVYEELLEIRKKQISIKKLLQNEHNKQKFDFTF